MADGPLEPARLARDASYDPGSFRDPESRVFLLEGRVLRGFTSRAEAAFAAVSASRFFPAAVDAGRIVRSARTDIGEAPVRGPWVAVVEHERIPFVSYPYEWSFGMLRDAAVLQLELLEDALAEGFLLKDASPYNVQWRGAAPVFIDVASFEPHVDGEPWIAYRQFCQLFLYPLMLQAWRGIPFHARLRGRIDGIPPAEFVALLGLRDLLRPSAFVHGWLHARASARFAAREATPPGLRITRGMIRANVSGLLRLLRGLRWAPGRTAWTGYAARNTYDDADRAAKAAFVERAVTSRPRAQVWDLGCNAGTYARIAARHAETVLAIDGDHETVERLYQELAQAQSRRILPLVMDLADPSPGLGWRGRERGPLEARGQPDLVLALALIHHLALGSNVPLPEVLDWLATLGGELVIEFVDRDDPMVRRLLRGRPDFADYRREYFEQLLAERYDGIARETLPCGTRILYHATPRRG